LFQAPPPNEDSFHLDDWPHFEDVLAEPQAERKIQLSNYKKLTLLFLVYLVVLFHTQLELSAVTDLEISENFSQEIPQKYLTVRLPSSLTREY
jgi:hypothetical protein